MDINAVSRALCALHLNYHSYFYWLGSSDVIAVRKNKPSRWLTGVLRRQAIGYKTRGLIAHDRELTWRNQSKSDL